MNGPIDFVGNIPIRQEIQVLSADEPKTKLHNQVRINSRGKMMRNHFKGWRFREVIGIAVINPRGLKNLKKSIIIGDKICQDVNTTPEIFNNLHRFVSTVDTAFMRVKQNMKLLLRKIFKIFKKK